MVALQVLLVLRKRVEGRAFLQLNVTIQGLDQAFRALGHPVSWLAIAIGRHSAPRFT